MLLLPCHSLHAHVFAMVCACARARACAGTEYMRMELFVHIRVPNHDRHLILTTIWDGPAQYLTLFGALPFLF